ncbi:glycosyltransferase [Sulfurisphaera javensis]|uniref:Glycosyltransferase n=1 Tax=Sulfurisphaera javensis TaxID=2049879 RepID=A0AAT9GVQ1_9CREN
MRILAVVDFGLNENTGGYQRNYEIMKRIVKKADVDIIPSIRNVKLISWRRELIKLLKELNSTPLYVIDLLKETSTVEDFVSGLKKEKYDVAMVYSNSSENIELARKLTTAPIGVQLQLEPFYRDYSILFRIMFRGVTGRAVINFKRAMEESEKEKEKWIKLIKNNSLHFITSVSKTPLINSGLDKLLPTFVTKPGNSFNREILSFRSEEKDDDYAVYYTRLMPEKGLFEVPIIWKKLNKDIKLYVMGNFVYEEDKEDFEDFVKRLNVNIEYLGFKQGEELYRIVSKASFTLYPSHYDSFSLVILESLALGTPVFAYNTPAIKEIYGGVKGVHLAKEDDINGLVTLIEKREKGEIAPIPEFYSSWDRVVDAELEDIKRGMISKS